MIAFFKPSIFRRVGMRWNKKYVLLWAFLSRIIPARLRPTFCLGDSHIPVWNYADLYQRGILPRFIPFMVRGATALGLSNPNSKTNAFKEFSYVLGHLPYGTRVLLNLGEVDCGFLIWHLAKRENLSIETVFSRAITSYLSFIDECRSRGFEVCVCAAPLPTIGNGPAIGEVAKLRAGVSVSQHERTKLTQDWNTRLREYCSSKNIFFVDTDDILLDETHGVIKGVYKNCDPGDHHLDSHAYAMALLLALRATQSNSGCKD